MNGSVGTDQHGDRWFLRNGNLYSEFSYHIIEPQKHPDPNEEIDMMIQDRLDREEFANEIFERGEGL